MRILERVTKSMCAALVAVFSLVPGAEALCQANYVYVDPWAGCDFDAVHNDPMHPYSTLQAAVDGCVAGDIVIANPGIYELHAPLMMQSLVSVQGVGARRCIIQPAPDMSTESIFWPDASTCGSSKDQKVLVDARHWKSREFIDGFTFRGGDVQIYSNTEGETSMAVSNCLFDLATPVLETTPSIGFLLVSVWVGQDVTYHKKRPNILNNTFLFGYRTYTTAHEPVDTLADVSAVGIVDVNNPLCPNGDGDQTLRGEDKPSVQNNLFRTLPSQGSQIVMLGIKDEATEASNGSTSGSTNAFRGNAVGGVSPANSSGEQLYSAIYGTSPSPKVDLGFTANDPSFVGEFLASKVYATLDSYRDFRIMPGSTMIDQGQEPVYVGGLLRITAKNDTFYERFFGVVDQGAPYHYTSADYDSFDYDMEFFGNPRIAGPHADIGFDEFHSLIVAGSYSNDDASHNQTHGRLTAAASGPSAERWLIVAPMFANATALFSANGADVVPGSNSCTATWISPAEAHAAWAVPIGALNPPYATGSPAGYATRFIDFSTPFPPTPWNGHISALITTDLNPISGAALNYCLFDINPVGGVLIVKDVEGNFDQHFELQGLIRLAGQGYYTNAQCEYR